MPTEPSPPPLPAPAQAGRFDALDDARRPPADTPGAQRRWRSSEIFGSDHVVEIEHGQAVYRLRLTALGKLILTK